MRSGTSFATHLLENGAGAVGVGARKCIDYDDIHARSGRAGSIGKKPTGSTFKVIVGLT